MEKKQLHTSLFLFMFILLIFFVTDTIAQPQYYNFNNGTVSNSFPLNQAAGKLSQTIVPSATFSQPSPAPAGNITKLYFRISDVYPLGPATYSLFKIMLLHVGSEFVTPGSFIPGAWDTVYKRDTITLSAAANTWLEFTLDHPFAYNPAQPLAISMEQCSATGVTTGFSLRYSSATGSRRNYSVGGCPFVYSGVSTNIINCGIDIAPPATGPDLLYYKFEDNPTTASVLNCAFPGVGTPIAPITGLTLTTGGQFDTCITGTGATSGGITTGFNWNLASSSWTISFWISAPPSTTISYYFGDAGSGSFRCFSGGVAGADSVLLRGTGITDVRIGPLGSSKVVTFVYDSAAANIKGYLNGALIKTISQTPLNITTGTGFKVGGYSTSASLNGKMDEFKLYRRALGSAEVASTWNADIPCGIIVGIGNNNNQLPANYLLEQNYPNPFNPVTKITFALPKAGDVKLTVYDMLGQQVNVLVNDFVNAGYYSINFDASNLSSGTYFYRLEAGSFVQTKKMQIIK